MEITSSKKASERGLFFFIIIFATNLLAQDTICLKNKELIHVNFRTIVIKGGIIKIPKVIDGQNIIYNYTPWDVDYIMSSDTNYIKAIGKQEEDITMLFAYRKANGNIEYYDEDLWRKKKTPIRPKKVLVDAKPFFDTIFNDRTNLNFKYGVRLSNNMSLYIFNLPTSSYNSANGSTTNYSSNGHDFSIISPSISFSIVGKRKNMHDFDVGYTNDRYTDNTTKVTNPNQNPIITNGGKTSSFGLNLGYRYNLIFMKKSNSKFLPSIGFAVFPTYFYYHFLPSTLISFEQTINTFSLPVYIEPTINYFISAKCFLFVSVPLRINQLEYRI